MNRTTLSYSVLVAIAIIPMHAFAGDDFPAPRDTEPSTTKPLSATEAAAGFRAPAGFRVVGLRRRAGRAEPDRHGLGPPRPALDRRELHLRRHDRAVRPPPPRPGAHLRGHGRRRPVRPPHGLHRRRADARQRRARPRRRLAALPAPAAVRPRPRRQRRPRRPRRGRARRVLGRRREPSHVRQRPAMGPRRLALRSMRGLLAGPDRHPRHARRAPRAHSRRPLALSPDTASGSRCSPTARRIPGATTGTRSARRSSSTRSTATSGT